MKETANSKGAKIFRWNEEDIERIRKENTESSKEFKEAYNEWRKEKKRPHYHIPKRKDIIKKIYRPKKNKPKWLTPNFKSSILLLFVIILVLFLYNVFINRPVNEGAQKLVNQTVEKNISFQEYINTPSEYYNEKITLKGYLSLTPSNDKENSLLVPVIIDDKNTQIKLAKVTSNFYSLFPKSAKTIEVYEVNGIFKRYGDSFNVEVNNIKLSKKESKIIQVSINENVADKTKDSFITNILNIFKSNFQETIFYNCSDGTNHNGCSSSKPFYCTNGTLIEKPNTCGCPETLKLSNSKCMETCSDGTIVGSCSSNKPYYCDNKKLIERPSSCGCKNNEVLSNDKCVSQVEYIELKVHEYTNLERERNGLDLLEWDYEINNIAREHSEDMITRAFFSHTNPDGDEPTDRGEKHGYDCRKDYGSYYTYGLAENIHQGWTYGSTYYIDGIESGKDWLTSDEIAKTAVDGWMNSPGHRENILEPNYDREGIGVGISFDGKVFVTQNFC